MRSKKSREKKEKGKKFFQKNFSTASRQHAAAPQPGSRGGNVARCIAFASRHFRAVGAGWTTFPTIFVLPVDSSD
jgi:hypothetical protein